MSRIIRIPLLTLFAAIMSLISICNVFNPTNQQDSSQQGSLAAAVLAIDAACSHDTASTARSPSQGSFWAGSPFTAPAFTPIPQIHLRLGSQTIQATS